MKWMRSPLFRDVIGFLAGGVNAAIATALVYWVFNPPGGWSKRSHAGQTMEFLVIVMFCYGGLIGRKGINSGFFTQLLPLIVGFYICVWFICIFQSMELAGIAAVFGYVTPGVVISAVVSLLLAFWLPSKPE